jgi:hypothetical protein
MADALYIPTAQEAQQADQAYAAQTSSAPYIPTAQEAQQADQEYSAQIAAAPLPAPAAPPQFPVYTDHAPTAQAAVPAPPGYSLQGFLNNVESGGKQVLHSIEQAPSAIANFMGNAIASGYEDPSIAAKLGTGTPHTDIVNKDISQSEQGLVAPLVGPQSMIGHGLTAAQQGPASFGKFVQGVPAGIGKETYSNPVGQVMNVLALVSGGEMGLGLGGKSLLSLGEKYTATAAKLDALGEADNAAAYRRAAQSATQAGQAMNRSAFAIHRAATGGPVGDAVRDHVAGIAEKLFPGSDLAKGLRASADTQAAAAAHLRARAQSIPMPEKITPTPSDVPAQPPALLSPQGAQEAEPLPPEPAPITPEEPPAPEAPVSSTEDNQVAAPPDSNVQKGSAPPFETDFEGKQAENVEKYSDIAKQSGQNVNDPAIQSAIQKSAATSLINEFDKPTGLLNAKSLDATMDKAAKYVKDTSQPAAYVQFRPTTTMGSPTVLRNFADYLQGELQAVSPATSIYLTENGDIGAVVANADPQKLGAALDSIKTAFTRHDGSPGLSYGVSPIVPGVKPADARTMTESMLGANPAPMIAALAASQAQQENKNGSSTNVSGAASGGASGPSGSGAAVRPEAERGQLGGQGSVGSAGGAQGESGNQPVGGSSEGGAGGGGNPPVSIAESAREVGNAALQAGREGQGGQPAALDAAGPRSVAANAAGPGGAASEPGAIAEGAAGGQGDTGVAPLAKAKGEAPDSAALRGRKGSIVESLTPKEADLVQGDLAKIKDDPQFGSIAAEMQAEIKARSPHKFASLNDIHAAPQAFQMRDAPFSETTAAAIHKEGFNLDKYNPIPVFKDGSGKYGPKGKYIVAGDGHSRFEGLKRLAAEGRAPSEIAVKIVSETAAHELARTANTSAVPFTPLELGKVFQRERESGLNAAQIAAEHRTTRQRVLDMLALNALPEYLRGMVGGGALKPELASVLGEWIKANDVAAEDANQIFTRFISKTQLTKSELAAALDTLAKARSKSKQTGFGALLAGGTRGAEDFASTLSRLMDARRTAAKHEDNLKKLVSLGQKVGMSKASMAEASGKLQTANAEVRKLEQALAIEVSPNLKKALAEKEQPAIFEEDNQDAARKLEKAQEQEGLPDAPEPEDKLTINMFDGEEAAPPKLRIPTGNPTMESPIVGAARMSGGAPSSVATALDNWKHGVQETIRRTIASAPGAASDLILSTKNATLGNLHYLDRYASPETRIKARELASSDSRVAVQLAAVASRMLSILGSAGRWHEFLAALVESRLRGIRQRWQSLSAEAANASESDLIESKAANGETAHSLDSRFKFPLDMLDGTKPEYEGLSKKIDDLLSEYGKKRDIGPIKDLLAKSFKDAASSTGSIFGMGIAPNGSDLFAAFTSAPDVQEALSVYKNQVEKELAASHADNEGIFSDDLGPLDTYYPLLPLDADGNPTTAASGKGAEFSSPTNMNNKFATGQSEMYDVSVDGMRRNMVGAFRRNSQAALMSALVKDKLLLPEMVKSDGAKASAPKIPNPAITSEAHRRGGKRYERVFATIDGRKFPARRATVATSKILVRNGKTIFIPGQRMVAPQWLVKELGPMVYHTLPEWGGQAMQVPGIGIFNIGNVIGIAGPLDAVLHTNNLLGTLVSETPYVPGGILANTPLTKNIGALAATIHTDPSSDANLINLREMARLGIVPPRYGADTFSSVHSEATGAELHRRSFGPLLFGNTGLDIRARLVMYRCAKTMAGLDPDQPLPMSGAGEFSNASQALEIAKYCDRLGQYNRALASRLVQVAKDSNLAPFAVAGSTMYRNGLRFWLRSFDLSSLPTGGGAGGRGGNGGGSGGVGGGGQSNAPGGGFSRRVGFKISQQLTGGMIGLVATWVLLHKQMTGKWPWQDSKSRLLTLPLPKAIRRNKIIEALYGKGDNTVYFGMGYFNPIGFRGAGGLGLRAGYDTSKMGGSKGQVQEAMLTAAMNAAASPLASGPGFRAAFSAATLDEPYATGLRDPITGKPSIQLMGEVQHVKPGLSGQLEARAGAAASDVNASFSSVAGVFGYGNKARQMEKLTTGGRWLKIIADLAFPRAVMGEPDPVSMFDKLQRADRAASAEPLELKGDTEDKLRQQDVYLGSLEPGAGETDAQFKARKEELQTVLGRMMPNVLTNTERLDPNARKQVLNDAIRSAKEEFKFQPTYKQFKSIEAVKKVLAQ